MNYFLKIKILSIILILSCYLSTFGQINLNDPSFERIFSGTLPGERWIHCEGSVDIWRADILPWLNHPDPIDGEQYIGMVCGRDNYAESISQRIPDTLKEGQNYFIDTYISYFYNPREGLIDTGHVSIYLGEGACDLSQKIASIKAPDTLWTQIRVHFTPDKNYTSLTFRNEDIEEVGINYIFIDGLSQIFIDETADGCGSQEHTIKVNSIPLRKSFSVLIDAPNQCNYTVNLFSISGQLIWKNRSLSENPQLFSLDNYPSGIYLLILTNNDSRTQENFLISNTTME